RARDGATPVHVDLAETDLAGADLAAQHPPPVHDEPGQDLLHVVHLDLAVAGGDDAGVGLLATALGVEGRGVEHQLDLLALTGCWHRPKWTDQRTDLRLACRLRVPGELHGAAGVEHRPVRGQVGVPALARGRVRLGPATLLGHELAKAFLVHAETRLRRDLQG